MATTAEPGRAAAGSPPHRPGIARERIPLLLLGMLALLGAVQAGLARAGLPLPWLRAEQIALHGPLMVCAFFGTVISLERAVALARPWAYLAPLAAGLGGLALFSGAAPALGGALMVGAAALLTLGSLIIHLAQRQLYTLTLTFGAAAWLGAALGWAGGVPAHRLVGLWMGFLVLTIAGERLELSRFLPPSPWAKRAFAAILAAFVLAMLAGLAGGHGAGAWLGATLCALAAWLLRQDVARRTVLQHGLTRFIAVCLLSGYGWLAAGGLLLLLPPAVSPFLLDAALHAVFLGFVFAMVFGHAPVIFPAVLRVRLPYHPVFYLPLAVLHASLCVRIGGGLAGSAELRAAGALLNALALAVFIATMLAAGLRGRRAGG